MFATGQVPNCERCHECFFQWDDNIIVLRQRITGLQSQISNLTEVYFNGSDVDSIWIEISLILIDLQRANETLNSITLQERAVEELQQMIVNVSCKQLYYSGLLLILSLFFSDEYLINKLLSTN